MTCKYLACLGPIHAAARVLGCVVLGTCLIGGCSKEEPREAAAPAAPELPKAEEYMKDPVFRERLKAQRAERGELLAQRAQVVRRLEAMSKAMMEKMPGASEAEVVAELEKDPEWRSLAKRADELVTAFEEKRAETLKTVRERLAPQPNLSK